MREGKRRGAGGKVITLSGVWGCVQQRRVSPHPKVQQTNLKKVWYRKRIWIETTTPTSTIHSLAYSGCGAHMDMYRRACMRACIRMPCTPPRNAKIISSIAQACDFPQDNIKFKFSRENFPLPFMYLHPARVRHVCLFVGLYFISMQP